MHSVVAIALFAAVLLARANQDYFTSDNLTGMLKIALIAKGNCNFLMIVNQSP